MKSASPGSWPPWGPLTLTAGLLVAGAIYFGSGLRVQPPARHDSQPPDSSAMRCMNWNLACAGAECSTAATQASIDLLVSELTRLRPHVVGLQSVPDEGFARRVAQLAGDGWRDVAIRRQTKPGPVWLAVLIRRDVMLHDQRIVSLGNGTDALAVSIMTPDHRRRRVVSFLISETETDAQAQASATLAWLDGSPGDSTILLGGVWPTLAQPRSGTGGGALGLLRARLYGTVGSSVKEADDLGSAVFAPKSNLRANPLRAIAGPNRPEGLLYAPITVECAQD